MTPLLQWLWQGTVLALGVAAVLHWTPRVNAATRHALWWLTLAATLALPFAGSLSAGLLAALSSAGVLDLAPPLTTSPTVAEAPQPWLALPAAPDWLIACGVGIWVGTVILGLGRLVAAMRTVHRLKRESRAVPASVTRWPSIRQAGLGAGSFRRRRGTVRGADLRMSSSVSGACALGLTGRPAVVISDRLLAELDADSLELIVLHELMHLRRYDDWLRVIQSAVLAVAGLHPAVRFISGRIDAEREAACDEAVAVSTGDPRRYAACLAAVADLIAGASAPESPWLVPNALGSGSLLARVQRLLDPRGCRHASLQAPALAAAALVMASLTTGAARLESVVAVASAEPVQVAETGPAAEVSLGGRVILAGSLLTLSPATAGVARPTAGTPRGATVGRRIDNPPTAALRDAPTGDRAGRQDSTVQMADLSTVEIEIPPVPTRPVPVVATLVAFPENQARNRESSGDNGWASTGASARRAGVAVGTYFSRAGQAVASQF